MTQEFIDYLRQQEVSEHIKETLTEYFDTDPILEIGSSTDWMRNEEIPSIKRAEISLWVSKHLIEHTKNSVKNINNQL